MLQILLQIHFFLSVYYSKDAFISMENAQQAEAQGCHVTRDYSKIPAIRTSKNLLVLTIFL